jgi:dipeptidyl aminopeptidase/acylaminoacyl peptidase
MRLFRSLLTVAILPAAAVFSLSAAQEVKVLTPEVVESLKSIGSVTMAPDGNLVAYVLNVPRGQDEEPGGSYSELWVLPFEGGEARPYVCGKLRVGGPAWSPDGKLLSFLTNRGQGTQVFVMPVDGGEAWAVTKSDTGINEYRWSPDGRSIAYIAVDPQTDDEKKAAKEGRDWNIVDKDFKHHRIHVVNIESGEDKIITPAEYTVWDFNWSPDGRSFVVTASDEPTTDASYMFKRLYVVNVEDGSRRLLCETEGKLGTPVWSPGGDKIAWNGGTDINDETAGTLYMVAAAGGEPLVLTPEIEATVYGCAWLDNDTIAFHETRRQHVHLYAIPAAGGEPRLLYEGANGKPLLGGPSFSADGRRLASSASHATHPGELFVGEVGDGNLRRLTDSNPFLSEYRFGAQEVVKWIAGDGLELEGILIKPVGYEEGKRYPLVVQVHGGPEGAYTDGWITAYSQWSQMPAGQGYVVFAPNYRASAGRGSRFGKADHFDLGGREFQDVVDGIDHLIAGGLVDGERVGIGGGSYGGYFSAIAATKFSDRFAASIVFAGISDWFSNMGVSDIPWENTLVHFEYKWYEHPERTWAASPVAYIRNAKTPTLICHGERDARVPIGQAWELYTGMKFVGCPVEFVIYPREPHGLREQVHRLDYAKRALAWYDKYLKNKD